MAEGRRAAHPQPFYAMRDIAKHFGLSLATVGLAYRELEHEGILTRIRGSQTLVAGTAASLHKPVRSVIGFPIRVHSFVVSPYSRALLVALEDRLQDNGFIADFIFFSEKQDEHPDFAERLFRRNLNFIIWHTPHPNTSQVMRLATDHGIQQMILQPTESLTTFAHPTYLLDWQSAYNKAGEAWSKRGIRNVVIPYPTHLPSNRVLTCFTAAMERKGIGVEVVPNDADALCSKAKMLSHSGPVVVGFLDLVGSEYLCNGQPVVMEKIRQFARIAFCRGPVRAPYFECHSLSADVVGFSAAHIADRIVSDIRRAPDFPKNILNTFQATYTPDVEFSARQELL